MSDAAHRRARAFERAELRPIGISTTAYRARTVGVMPIVNRTNHELYNTWRLMLARCYKPAHADYTEYGKRGIEVCRRWRESFDAFVADLGPRPPGATIDRRDNDGDYERANVRWATRTEQNRNSRHCKLTLDGAQEVLGRLEHGEAPVAVADRFGVTPALVYAIRAGKCWRELPRIATQANHSMTHRGGT